MPAQVVANRLARLFLDVHVNGEKNMYRIRPCPEADMPQLVRPLTWIHVHSPDIRFHTGYDSRSAELRCTCLMAGNIGTCPHVDAAVAAQIYSPTLLQQIDYLAAENVELTREIQRLGVELETARQIPPNVANLIDDHNADLELIEELRIEIKMLSLQLNARPERPDPEPIPNPYAAEWEPQPGERWRYIRPRTTTPVDVTVIERKDQKAKVRTAKGSHFWCKVENLSAR